MKYIIASILILSFTSIGYGDDTLTNGDRKSLNDPILPPAKAQCPPSDRPGYHQKADGTWVRN